MSFLRVLVIGASVMALAPRAFAEDRGRVVYVQWCEACHGTGPDKPGTLALQAKYKGAIPARLDARSDLVPELVKVFVRRGVSVMPPFRKTEISDRDLDALAAYLAKSKS